MAAAAAGSATRLPESPEADGTRIAAALSGKPAAPPQPPQPAQPAQRTRRRQDQPAARPGRPAAPPAAASPEVSAPQRAARPDDVLVEEDDDAFDDGISSLVDEPDEDFDAPESAEIKAIDATLARFSAVHDEIAHEEEVRRKRYSWLLGKRKEPELGEDMPFDFVEGRDAKASRLEWKKAQRKKRSKRIVSILLIAAAIAITIVVALRWIA